MNFIFKKLISLETLILFLILSFVVIAPITTDDGWNFYIFDNYLKSGDLFLLGFDVNANFSRLTYILQASLLSCFNFSLAQFIYVTIFSLIGFFAVSKLVATHFNGAEKSLYYTLYILFFFSTFYILKTRPEAVYVNLLLVIIYKLTINLNQRLSFVNLILISIILAFASASHPNGLFGLIILLIYLIESRKNLPQPYILVVAFVTFVLFAFLFTFYKISITDFIYSLKKLSKDSGHSVPFYKEYLRYLYFCSNNKILLPLLFPLILIVIKYRSSLSSHFSKLFNNNKHFSFSIKCLLCGLCFLFINPAKWDTYLVLILLFVIELIVFLSSVISKKERYLFIAFNSILIFFSWVHSSKINEASVFNRVINQIKLDALNKQCSELAKSTDIVFVQHGIYPLFRTYPRVNIFWQISNNSDVNIPDFENVNLDTVNLNISKIAIVTGQKNLTEFYNVSICDSIKFNNKIYFIYKNL